MNDLERPDDVGTPPHPCCPGAGTTRLSRDPEFRVTVSYRGGHGLIDVSGPPDRDGRERGFSCLLSDLPYILLCDWHSKEEAVEEVARLRAELGEKSGLTDAGSA